MTRRFLARAAFAAALGALALLAACRGEPRPRVLVLALDGLDPRVVDLLMSEGKMPNFARLRQQGAYGKLLSQKPMLSPILWTTIATGKTPDQHGIGHFVAVDAEGRELPVTREMRRVKALWNLASEAERQVAVVGWWATWPPETVRGHVVSDHTAYHFLFSAGMEESAEPGSTRVYPPELWLRIEPLLRRPVDLTPPELARFVDLTAEELARPFSFEDEVAHFRWALATAESYRAIGLELWRREQPDLALVYIEGTDSTSHLFGHLFRTEGLVGELAEQQRRFGRTVEEMYLYADELVGSYLEALGSNATLVVLSDHGFELGELHDDPTRTRDLRRVSERFHREEGILYLYGHGVRPGGRLDRPSILDITPTVLTLLGLPAAADMPGRALVEGLTGGKPPERVASYEGSGPPHPAAPPSAVDETLQEAHLAHLRSLGYLGGGSAAATSPQGDRNLAAISFEQGDYREAARMYHRLVEADPEDSALRTSFAGALGALGRFDDALVQLELALATDPVNVEAYHNRAVLHERRGAVEAAIADYRTALRYSSSYEPSRNALRRLTGSAEVTVARTETELRAVALAEEASQAARRGDYPGAMSLLDQAEALTPRLALVYQYRANVAFLMGDRQAAAAALERALDLEPDNALYRRNLENLRRP